MADTQNIGTTAVQIVADNTARKRVLNQAGGTVYYKTTANVTSGSNDGELAEAASHEINQTKYYISASSSRLVVTALTDSTAEDLAIADDLTVAGDLAVTGTSTVTGGLIPPSAVSPRILAVEPTSLTYGTDKTPVATETYFAEIKVPANVTLTGVEYLIGSVGGTNSMVGALFSGAGVVLANTALAGTVVGTTATFQRVAFTATYAAKGPAQYFVGLQVNGTTARFRTIPDGPRLAAGKKTAETFGTLTTITAPTTFTADLGPVAGVY